MLLLGVHRGPAALTFFLNCSLGGIFTKIIGDDGASSLHVEKVRGKRALGSIGVVSTLLLAFLLLYRTCSGELRGKAARMLVKSSMQWEDRGITNGGGLPQKQVGLTQIVDREGLDKILNCRQTCVDLDSVLVVTCRAGAGLAWG